MNPNLNFNKFINALQFDDPRTAIIENEKDFSYHDLRSKIDYYIAILEQKNIENKIVYLLSDYSFNSISIFFALTFCRNVIVPVVSKNENERLQRMNILKPDYQIKLNDNVFEIINSSEKIDQRNHHSIIQSLFQKNTPGVVLFSSGTTGKPKAMIHDLNKLLGVFLNKRKKKLNFILMLLFDHIGGLNTLFNCLSMNSTVIIPEKKTPEGISYLIDKHKINILPSSPTFLNLILMGKYHEQFSFDSLRLITYGTERMPESLLNRLKKSFPRVKFLQTFGTSETGIATTTSESSSSTFFKIDQTNQEYKIVNNELWLRSDTQIKGYINSSNDSFTEDGWFKTGDIVEVKDDFIKIIGRKTEVINVGGEKVIASEIENVILEMNEIIDCTVKGEINPITGQYVIAEVLTNYTDKKKLKLAIKKHCRNNLESYKVPVKINFIKSLKHTERFKKKL